MTQKPRRIGMGMKPRATEEANLPTVEGQEEPALDPIQEQITAAVEGGDLESVSAGPSEEVLEESPESAEKELELHATEVPAVPEEAFDALAAVMKASEAASGVQNLESIQAAYEQVTFPTPPEAVAVEEDVDLDALAEKMLPEMMEGLPTIADIEAAIDRGAKVDLATDGKVTIAEPVFLGELPTGEYRHTVRIAESYVEGAKQQAEADNMNLEDWLTQQLHCYLEQWWFAAGPKS